MKFRFVILSFLISISATAQEMWGISNSNFSGHMGLFLNPTIIVGAPYQYEINLVALDQFAENTFLYLPLKEKIIPLGLEDDLKTKPLYTNSSGTLNGFSHELIIGPSYIHNKKDYAWGIHSAYRSELSILKINSQLANLIHNNFNYPPFTGTQYSAQPFSSTYASWFELGGTYGKIYKENEKNTIRVAATVNALLGNNAYAIDVKNLDFTSVNPQQVIIHQMGTTISNTVDGTSIGIRGAGLSTTLGAVYIKGINRGAFDCNMSNDRQRKYKYRLGVSLIDVGMIHYFSKTQVTNIALTNDYVWNGVDTLNSSSSSSFDSTLVLNTGGTIEEKSFNIILPLAISVQFDYQLRANLFANATIVNRIHFSPNQIARGNQLNLAVRYEKRRYEGTVSLNLFEYKKPSLGVGLRYRFLVIGSDRLLQLLGVSDAPSTDIFFGLKFQFCKKPFSKGPDCPAYLSN